MNKNLGKIGRNSAFSKMTKAQQTAIRRLFEKKTLKSIAQEVGVNRNTISNWKNNDDFKEAQSEYAVSMIEPLLFTAVQKLYEMLNSHKTSSLVKFQIIQMLFKYSNLLSDNSTPELDKAKIRKANADARVAEARAKAMEDNGADVELLLDKMMDTLAKEDLKHGSK